MGNTSKALLLLGCLPSGIVVVREGVNPSLSTASGEEGVNCFLRGKLRLCQC